MEPKKKKERKKDNQISLDHFVGTVGGISEVMAFCDWTCPV
jgi:hypothetical protein